MDDVTRSSFNELGDELFLAMDSDSIAAAADPFADFFVVVPNKKIEQWVKTRWLRKNSSVLMNVHFMRADEAFLRIADPSQTYQLVNKNELTVLIMKHLVELSCGKHAGAFDSVAAYLFDNPQTGESPAPAVDGTSPAGESSELVANSAKLFGLADHLAQLFLEYDKEMVDYPLADDTRPNVAALAWERELYKRVMSEAFRNKKGTLRSIGVACGTLTDEYIDSAIVPQEAEGANAMPLTAELPFGATLHLFGFVRLEAVYKRLLEEYEARGGSVQCYFVQPDDAKETIEKPQVKCIAAPSRLREVEAIHGEICKTILGGDGSLLYGDFLIFAPDISRYENEIARVFHQNGRDFPDIPYALIGRKTVTKPIDAALQKLTEIALRGNITRLDIYELSHNSLVQSVRGITSAQADAWLRAMNDTNAYRMRQRLLGTGTFEQCDDWDYLEKRLLVALSCDSNDENEGGEAVLSGEAYVPYETISLDESTLTITKLLRFIQDLRAWIACFDDADRASGDFAEAVLAELKKWLCDYGEIKSRSRFAKIERSVAWWKACMEYSDASSRQALISPSAFMRILEAAVSSGRGSKGELFTHGVSFVDFDANCVLSARYVYLMGVGSSEFSGSFVQSEFDFRVNPGDVERERMKEVLRLQQKNAEKEFFVSYVNKDLATDEDYFLSPIVSDMFAINDPLSISLDENRNWSELFTSEEYRKKDYRLGLIKGGGTEKGSYFQENKASSTMPDDMSVSDWDDKSIVWRPRMKVRDVADAVSELLKYRLTDLFGHGDESDAYAHKELEPFNANNLDKSNVVKTTLKSILVPANIANLQNIDEPTLRNTIRAQMKKTHSLPDISDHYAQQTIDTIIGEVEGVCSLIADNVGSKYDVLALPDLEMAFDIPSSSVDSGFAQVKWTLECPKEVCCGEDSSGNLCYIDLKKTVEAKKNNEFCYLYIVSLMDVASRVNGSNEEAQKPYTIRLLRGSAAEAQKEFSCTPKKAFDTLNGIYRAIHEWPDIFMSVDFIGDSEPKDFEAYRSAAGFGYDAVPSWQYFDDKVMVDRDKQLGCTRDNFDTEFKTWLGKLQKLVLFADKPIL